MHRRVNGSTQGSQRRARESSAFARPFIVLLLLIGLWVMHGMSGTTDAGCHGAVMPALSASSDSMPRVAAAPSAETAAASRTATTSIGMGWPGQMRHGELCVSGQPPTPGQDLLALLALLALAGYGVSGDCLRLSVGRVPRLARWQAPPSPFGIQLLTTVCVSRT